MMTASDVVEIITVLDRARVDVWLDGGWGVDALVRRQTRSHDDLDVVVALVKAEEIQKQLEKHRFAVIENELPTRFVLKDARSRQIDFHTVTFDKEGGGVQRLQDDRSYRYPPQGFEGIGAVNGREMKCLTAEVQAECHYGYEPDEKDRHDMQLLHEHFGIELWKPYR
ncbi:MAG: amino acid transporter [Candidatus Abyssobacteria bacterium SURF_17]|jgi:lincosamide nucleotidyltransferase A/C/D/E|uniref:Amino acid transporter n=1 Tax=Candidatus Abyssobacteria bacterium SURF_17 TaxID=2093361 RepID=A0A419ENR3_9BACT|nr:MAG: amino acid transporter [Candidatus Abyssubacteria bacterium SURF_17]